MANLKDTIVLGNLTVTGTFTASDLFITGGTLVGVGISSVTSSGWTNKEVDSALIPTMNFIAYWKVTQKFHKRC